MGTEAERQDTRKAVILDLLIMANNRPEQDQITIAEIKRILQDYIVTANQK